MAAHLSGFISGVAIGLARLGIRARGLLNRLRKYALESGSEAEHLLLAAFPARIAALSKRPPACRHIRPTTSFRISPSLEPLREIVFNVWWTWEPSARRLFRHLDPELWDRTNHNPVRMLQLSRQARLVEVAEDEDFLRELKDVHEAYAKYLARTDTYGKTGEGNALRNRSPISRPNSASTNRSQITPAASAFFQAIIANRRAIST